MKRILILLAVSLPGLILMAGCSGAGSYPDGDSRYEAFAPDGIPFVVADSTWAIDQRGNHRAVVTVAENSGEGVLVELPWRRPDLNPETKKILVTDAEDKEIKDVVVTKLTPEKGEILFKPVSGPGTYYIYYLPYKWQYWYANVSDYLTPEYEADKQWSDKVALDKDKLPKAKVDRFESASRFNFWSPMGLIATQEETASLNAATGKDMVIFPEDRAFPIQFSRYIPAKWVKGPETEFKGLAMRNEYYVWQFGVWAAGKELKNVKVAFSELKNGGSVIGAEAMTCFNQEGVSWDGSSLDFTINVPKDKLQALWCGVQIPEDAKPGVYKGQAVITAEGVDPQTIDLAIKVSSKVLADKGDSEVWRLARLRWLNSTIALDDNEPTFPYKEMIVNGRTIEATGKTLELGGNGMVSDAKIGGISALNGPQKLVVYTLKGFKIPILDRPGEIDAKLPERIIFSADNVNINKEASGLVTWTASSEQSGIKFNLAGTMEYDGHIHFDINVSSAGEDIEVKDIRLETPYSAYSSEYFMGIGFKGGYRPASYSWDWTGPFDSFWMGGVKAGLHTEFRGGEYHGPLLRKYRPAPAPVWYNGGKGRVTVSGAKGAPATVVASTGPNVIGKEPKNFEFNLLLTPVKEPDPAKHFSERYFHAIPADFDRAAEDGANIMNIHHARNLNPYINYPFIVRDSLVQFINHQHDNGRKVKLYYTIRELSVHCEEIHAFHSLNHEVIREGGGKGNAWMCEHMIEDYAPNWYTSLHEFKEWDSDPAVQLIGNSRYINYFLEGVRWMEENYGIDGLYMDDVSCDRGTIKRLRKILDGYHDGSRIDLHSNDAASIGPMNQYAEFFPYMDRLWFGESFRYNQMSPDQWLVTFSGIPFGVMSEMLQDGGNRFLGMVYGTTARHSWTDTGDDKSPVPMWKFWEKTGIKDARMLGYWDPDCPVRTSDPEVKATAYVKDGITLVSIGNFSEKDKTIRLTIDWKAIGIDPAKAKVTAPAIPNFQEEISFAPLRMTGVEKLSVKAKEGWMLVIEKEN